MATSDFWQRVSASVAPPSDWVADSTASSSRSSQGKVKLWILLDLLTVLVSAGIATIYERHTGPVVGARAFYHGTLFYGRSMWILLAMLCGFATVLVVTSRRMHLYSPTRLNSFLNEQRLTVQVCFTSGLLLTGTLYLVRAEDIPRGIVVLTLTLVTVSLCLRRLIYRTLLYRKFERGEDTRNVLIVGTGPEAYALRHHLESIRHLGYTFKGFIEFPGATPRMMSSSGDVVGTLDTLFQHARKQFVDEIFFTTPCERSIVQDVLEKSRMHGVDLRVVPDLYARPRLEQPDRIHRPVSDHPAASRPGSRTRLHVEARARHYSSPASFSCCSRPFSLSSPLPSSSNPMVRFFYASERIGKKGRVFRCYKFRTMVRDAEKRRAEVMHMNERDGVLFKITNDPRITRLGRILAQVLARRVAAVLQRSSWRHERRRSATADRQ